MVGCGIVFALTLLYAGVVWVMWRWHSGGYTVKGGRKRGL